MGWAFNGKCFPDTGTALNAFVLETVKIDPVGFNYFSMPPTINSGGLITWSIYNKPLTTSNLPSLRTGTLQLPTCLEFSDNKFELLAVQDVLAAIGIGLAFVVGIVAGNMK